MIGDYGSMRNDLILLLEKYQIGKREKTSDAVLADYLFTCLDGFETAIWSPTHRPKQED